MKAGKCEVCGRDKILLYNFYACPVPNCTPAAEEIELDFNLTLDFHCPRCGSNDTEPFPMQGIDGLWHCMSPTNNGCGHVWRP